MLKDGGNASNQGLCWVVKGLQPGHGHTPDILIYLTVGVHGAVDGGGYPVGWAHGGGVARLDIADSVIICEKMCPGQHAFSLQHGRE